MRDFLFVRAEQEWECLPSCFVGRTAHQSLQLLVNSTRSTCGMSVMEHIGKLSVIHIMHRSGPFMANVAMPGLRRYNRSDKRAPYTVKTEPNSENVPIGITLRRKNAFKASCVSRF